MDEVSDILREASLNCSLIADELEIKRNFDVLDEVPSIAVLKRKIASSVLGSRNSALEK
jgi:hypothetical protein